MCRLQLRSPNTVGKSVLPTQLLQGNGLCQPDPFIACRSLEALFARTPKAQAMPTNPRPVLYGTHRNPHLQGPWRNTDPARCRPCTGSGRGAAASGGATGRAGKRHPQSCCPARRLRGGGGAAASGGATGRGGRGISLAADPACGERMRLAGCGEEPGDHSLRAAA